MSAWYAHDSLVNIQVKDSIIATKGRRGGTERGERRGGRRIDRLFALIE